MKYTHLGKSGLVVSRLCLGCMSFGDPANGRDVRRWTLREDEARPILRAALDAGINFFDTANAYSGGTSEEIVGKVLKEYGVREEIVLATKLYYPMGDGPNRKGLSRKAIMQEIDASLRRLGTDYIDLYITHRWDDEVPAEEIMEAFNDVIRAGKARYIGASTLSTWQLAKAQRAAELHGWAKFISVQNLYNLVYREDERDMIPFCRDQGLGLTPWSPLAKGRLARPVGTQTFRSGTDSSGDKFFGLELASDREIVDRVAQIALRHGIGMSQVAIAWLLSKPCITAPLIGCTRPDHLTTAVGALSVSLDPEEIEWLESAYEPHAVKAF